MKSLPNRRKFLKTAAMATGAAAFGFPAFVRGQNLYSKLNIAAIGAGGRGAVDTDCCASENIVALCDVDKNVCTPQFAKYPEAKFYHDFRKMFEEMGKSIDAVTVSTPDHTHAIITATAMSLGKHVYCQKPLTQTIHETRCIRDLARRKRIITQMGNQGSAEDGLRRGVEVIQSGLIGTVREVHVWSNRPIWPQGMNRPDGSDPVPKGLDWDLWIGPAAMRPYKSEWPEDAKTKGRFGGHFYYHSFAWRGWQEFGTGALGDMACHTVNLPFRALQLGYPTQIEAEAVGTMNKESYPIGSKIRFQFPSRGKTEHLAPVTLWWYDGGKPTPGHPYLHDGSNKPPRELLADVEAFRGTIPPSGCLIIGDKGIAFSPDDMGSQVFVKLTGDAEFTSQEQHPAVGSIPVTLPRNRFKGPSDTRHHLEWIAAIKENKPELCYSRFDVAAELTEIMLLGCVALRVGKQLEWDGPTMRSKNAPEAATIIKRADRSGWEQKF